MEKDSMVIVLPTGEINIEDKEITISRCQVMTCTPQEALTPAFVVNKLVESESVLDSEDNKEKTEKIVDKLNIDHNETYNNDCEKIDIPALKEQTVSIRLTNMSVENAVIRFFVHGERILHNILGEQISCIGIDSIMFITNGIRFESKNEVFVTKDFKIGETIEIEIGDQIIFDNKNCDSKIRLEVLSCSHQSNEWDDCMNVWD